LWPGKANPIGTCVDNIGALNPTILNIDFENFNKIPIFKELTPASYEESKKSGNVDMSVIQKGEKKMRMGIIACRFFGEIESSRLADCLGV
jgi:hypothetical protein